MARKGWLLAGLHIAMEWKSGECGEMHFKGDGELGDI
jgi:hypothetical protein